MSKRQKSPRRTSTPRSLKAAGVKTIVKTTHIAEPKKSGTRVIKPRFGQFVTGNEQYYQHVDRVRNKVKTYIKKHRPKRPLNILLAAPPGSGKSFLIKQIISAIESEDIKKITNDKFAEASFEEIYISALNHPNELFAMFQRVQSLNLEYKIPFVFFDEIDSDIEGRKIYSKLLSPMWDGQFYIGKDKFLLGQAVFFFAGSGLSCESESEKIFSNAVGTIGYDEYWNRWLAKFKEYVNGNEQQKEKLPDFVDRIDSILRIPPISQSFLGYRSLDELQDIVCMLVKKHFANADLIGKEVLKQLSEKLMEPNAMREVEKLIFSSSPPVEKCFDTYRLNEGAGAIATANLQFEPEYLEIKIVKSKI